MALHLTVVSPERIEVDSDIVRVTVPGTSGRFEVLANHAPIISSLQGGTVEYATAAGTHTLTIRGGFIEVKDNIVSLCVEI